jgi:uncharacterized protein
MEMNLHVVSDNQFRACSDNSVTIKSQNYTSNIIVTNNLVMPLLASNSQSVTLDDLKPLLEFKPDLIIFTTSANKIIYPQPAILTYLQNNAIGFEVMTIKALCRTYNFLVGEGRKVGAVICFA